MTWRATENKRAWSSLVHHCVDCSYGGTCSGQRDVIGVWSDVGILVEPCTSTHTEAVQSLHIPRVVNPFNVRQLRFSEGHQMGGRPEDPPVPNQRRSPSVGADSLDAEDCHGRRRAEHGEPRSRWPTGALASEEGDSFVGVHTGSLQKIVCSLL